MHARAIPIALKWFGVPVDAHTIFLGCALKQISAQPSFVACPLGTFGKGLEFPLPGGHLGIDALDIEASLEA